MTTKQQGVLPQHRHPARDPGLVPGRSVSAISPTTPPPAPQQEQCRAAGRGDDEQVITRVLDVGDLDQTASGHPYRVICTDAGLLRAVGWLSHQVHPDMIGFPVVLRWHQVDGQRILTTPPHTSEPHASTAVWQRIRAHQARTRRAVARRRSR